MIRYDDGPMAVLQDAADLEAYIGQNSSREVQRKRELRMALRALEGQIVVWPYVHITVSVSLSLASPFSTVKFSPSGRIRCGVAAGAIRRTTRLLTIRVSCASSAAAT